jgi:LuxR family maltose regulon positive regulatory protein
MHLVIASRADPPLKLARLRARSELNELRLSDLCFTDQEAEHLLNQVMTLGLMQEQVAALTTRTEGWVAGLQMAAISLRSVENKADFIESFSGSNRYILDYLVEEVLRNRSKEV